MNTTAWYRGSASVPTEFQALPVELPCKHESELDMREAEPGPRGIEEVCISCCPVFDLQFEVELSQKGTGPRGTTDLVPKG